MDDELQQKNHISNTSANTLANPADTMNGLDLVAVAKMVQKNEFVLMVWSHLYMPAIGREAREVELDRRNADIPNALRKEMAATDLAYAFQSKVDVTLACLLCFAFLMKMPFVSIRRTLGCLVMCAFITFFSFAARNIAVYMMKPAYMQDCISLTVFVFYVIWGAYVFFTAPNAEDILRNAIKSAVADVRDDVNQVVRGAIAEDVRMAIRDAFTDIRMARFVADATPLPCDEPLMALPATALPAEAALPNSSRDVGGRRRPNASRR